MNMERIRRALEVETGHGRRSVIRARSDVAEIVADCVLRRRSFQDIATRCGVDIETVARFRRRFITEQVKKLVIAESQKAEADDLDAEINAGQDEIQKGLREILGEQKALYRDIKNMLGKDRELEELLPALQSLLRDQGQSFERLLKSYSTLKDKHTIVLSLNEHPEISKLMDVLYTVFELHPEAFETFKQVLDHKNIPLDVQ